MEKESKEYFDFLNYMSDQAKKTTRIENDLFKKYNVKRGLRNEDHSGVLVGLTNVGEVTGYRKTESGEVVAVEGELYYRGIDVVDLVKGFQSSNRFGFEESVYLLLTGILPNKTELEAFNTLLAQNRALDTALKTSIIELKGTDIMNMLSRSIMIMHTRDCEADDLSISNVMQQSVKLIAKIPTIIAYAYHSMMHHYYRGTLSIRHPNPELSMAENFLYMLKGENNYTLLDAQLLDLALVLHAEHGGGNNSTFTIRVTSSSGTDTYSAVTSAISSLKGPLHGGANLKVMDMLEHLKVAIKEWKNETEIRNYLQKILDKKAYDNSGKIYGIGHAVYTLSDPRAILLKQMARELAIEKGKLDEFEFLERIERISIDTFMKFKGETSGKTVCINVDYYSGFVYALIGLPKEIFTPLFAMSRIAGWCAHRIEELNFDSKRIIRPAYKNVCEKKKFIPLDKR